ncbi:MAG: hypothetical protein ONB24_07515 [candidate division KSB1 bacterium]|nr:hypothetical protein [candidate division KSB1 bacterium]
MNVDPGRTLRIAAYFIFLIGLVLYSGLKNPLITLAKCLDNPEKYDGSIIVIGNETIVTAVADSFFVIDYLHRRIPIRGRMSPDAVGQFVVIKARFTAPDRIEALEYRVAEGRRAKIFLSILPTLAAAWLFFKRYRFSFKTFLFVERKCPT